MIYRLDKRNKREKLKKYSILIGLLILFILLRGPIFSVFSSISQFIFRPIYSLNLSVQNQFSNWGTYFYSKTELNNQNENLKNNLDELNARYANYQSLLEENQNLKEVLNRKPEKKEMILANILTKPNQSLFDTILLDVGGREGLRSGSLVYAYGNLPIGKIVEVYARTAKAILFSSSGEKTEAIISLKQNNSAGGSENQIKNTFMLLTGRGGGNFEMILPRDLILVEGTEALLPGTGNFVLAKVQTIISDPRDSFQKAILISPINILELKSVQVEI